MSKLLYPMALAQDGSAQGIFRILDCRSVESTMQCYIRTLLYNTGALLCDPAAYRHLRPYWLTTLDSLLFGRICIPLPDTGPEDATTPDITERLRTLPKRLYDTGELQAAMDIDTEPIETDHISELKQNSDKDIVLFAAPHTALQLMQRGLIDEVQLVLAPPAKAGRYGPLQHIAAYFSLAPLNMQVLDGGGALLRYVPRAAYRLEQARCIGKYACRHKSMAARY